MIFNELIRFLGLQLHSLSEIEFKDLFMRIKDYRDTILKHWIWITIGVEEIWRNIRCFVISEVVFVLNFGKSEYLNLILEISWLYSMNAIISIRLFIIFVEDKVVKE